MNYALYFIAAIVFIDTISIIHRSVNKQIVAPPTATVTSIVVIINSIIIAILIMSAKH